jgi:hypothetical protein
LSVLSDNVALIVEKNKKTGVCYAVTADGVELPVVDVSHPAFALTLTDTEQRALVDEFMRRGTPLRRLPKPLRNLLLQFFLRGSVLAHIGQYQGTFVSGMHTYLLKIGPEMLASDWAKPIDRRIAASLPVLGVRLRLQDVAGFMADALLPPLLADRRRPLHFVNIAGGTGIDSMNALILLKKNDPGIMAERHVTINLLDLDDEGPAFGQYALTALTGQGGSLHSMQVDFRHVRYNWATPANLELVLRDAHTEGAVAICSSEGGLFEYGSDPEIEANLRVLRAWPGVLAIVGSVIRADKPTVRLLEMSPVAVRLRGLELFRRLVQKTGWHVTRVVERPFSDQFVLKDA